MHGAWDNEPFPITHPAHPTGIGSNEAGHLVVGWGGPGALIEIPFSSLLDDATVERTVAELLSRDLAGATAVKGDFLRALLLRRLER